MIRQTKPTFSDSICNLRTRKVKTTFFKQINALIDWKEISKIIKKDYSKGKSSSGNPSYDGLLLFKMCLLQNGYGLSHYEVEDRINDSLSFSYFCGMSIEECSPGHSTLSRFRTALTKTKTFDKLFNSINKQLVAHNIIIKTGLIVDASVVDRPLRPKEKSGDNRRPYGNSNYDNKEVRG